jgi:hypothetical protein
MKEEIRNNLENPAHLEKLYRENKPMFRKAFDMLYPEIQQTTSAQFWHERLNYAQKEISWGAKNELIITLAIAVIAGLIAKLPDLAGIDPDYFYPRNIAFIVFPMLAIYFSWKQSLPVRKMLIVSFVIVSSAVYINILPDSDASHTLILACIHLALFLWAVMGYTFTGNQYDNLQKRTDFLRFNGDLLVITAVLFLAGAILSAVTIGLFELINLKIAEFYFQNIAIWGLAAVPVIGTYLVQTNPQLVKNVSPIVAKVFTPLVLVMVVVYLVAIVYTGKDPYNDREFLLIFNALLIGVMAIIFFSVAETSKDTESKTSHLMLLLLSFVTIIINGIALSAIIFRISEWGITPNRLAVLGSNILILINLVMVTYKLFKTLQHPGESMAVDKSIAIFLPVYVAWTAIVTFLFPVVFNFQ